jgi:5-methylcytosine-specific restriction endonuclease McrA
MQQQEWTYRHHSNDQLLEELHACQRNERRSTARALRVLEEVDRRRLYAELGYPSLYQFCVEVLHHSEHEAYLRMYAARTGRRFPAIFEMLERGALHLTAVDKLGPHLTDENHRALLDAATHKTKRQIEELLALRFPQPAVTESIRRLPVRTAAPTPLQKQPELAPAAAPPPARRETIAPLAPDRYAVRFTATARCRELLDRAKELMSHRTPNADAAALIEAGLEALVEKLEKQKLKTTVRPRKAKTSESGRHIPAAVARAVHARDGGRCTFLGPDGQRCDCRAFLELDHIIPIAKGGKSTVDNLRLRCRAHNQLTARQEFGDEYIALRAQGFRPCKRSRDAEDLRGRPRPS